MTLTEFLLARIAEDEDRDEANEGYWRYAGLSERLAAECDSKRRILEAAAPDQTYPRGVNPIHQWGYVVGRLLALPYADHPDYREEWKP